MEETADEEVEVLGIRRGYFDHGAGAVFCKIILLSALLFAIAAGLPQYHVSGASFGGSHVAIVAAPFLVAIFFGEARVPVGALLLVGGVAAGLFGYVTWQETRDAFQSMGVLGNLAKAMPELQDQLQSARIWLIAGASSAAFGLALLLSAVVWAVRSVRSQLTDG